MKEKGKSKISLSTFLLVSITIILFVAFLFLIYIIILGFSNKQTNKQIANINTSLIINNTENELMDNNNTSLIINPIENEIKNDIVSNFDLSFLKLENQKENKVYSPLSIKYALKMLEDGSTGDAKSQISKVVGNTVLTKYNSNNNMSLANALVIRDSFKNNIKRNYINTIKAKYNGEVMFDSLSTPQNVNSWVSNKTLKLVDNMVENINQDTVFLLINALGIDMEWENKFLKPDGVYYAYRHENFKWRSSEQVVSYGFDKNKQKVSGMEFIASINNYDIVEEIGEENIRKTVGNEYRKWAKEYYTDLSDKEIEEKLTEYLDGGFHGTYYSKGYIAEIDSNYKQVGFSTDFSLYIDDNVKAFAKDLKEYDGTTLQYIGIMPITEDLDSYIKDSDETEINSIINNLKDLKPENFKEGVVTKIIGNIPKFNFEYELNLKEDIKQLGITDVFEEGKANLTEICDNKEVYITDAVHKANIEFTQDGIKAAAATEFAGSGAGILFDYLYDVPVEEIDLTFDKPFMFLIRDKKTGEIWFMGTVYEPLLWDEEPEKDRKR